MSGSTPLLGVVVAAFDAERWIDEALDSLRAEPFADWACVVVDDGSTDGTLARVRRHAEQDGRLVVVERPNGGPSAARNTGLRALPYGVRLLTFLDADDSYLFGGLGMLVDAARARPDAVGVFGLAEYCDDDGKELHPGLHPERQRDRRRWQGGRLRPLPMDADSTFADLVEYGPGWPPHAVVLQAAAVRAVGGFDEGLQIREDWDLHLRLSRTGRFAVLNQQVGWYRRHEGNLTRGRLGDELVRRQIVRATYASVVGPDRAVVRWSVARGHVIALRSVTGRLRTAVRRRDGAAVLRLGAATVWSVALAVRFRPGMPSRRHVCWSYGVPADADDVAWEG